MQFQLCCAAWVCRSSVVQAYSPALWATTPAHLWTASANEGGNPQLLCPPWLVLLVILKKRALFVIWYLGHEQQTQFERAAECLLTQRSARARLHAQVMQ